MNPHNIKSKKKVVPKVVPIDWVDDVEKYILVPSYVNNKVTRRIKELKKVKGNCYFVSGVAYSLIDFIYRAVIKLGLKDEKLIFSRGAVKKNKRSISNKVDIYELDWDVGTSILIPRKLNYKDKIKLMVNEEEHTLRVMEIVVLSGLLQIAFSGKSHYWYSSMAASIITNGWDQIKNETPVSVYRIELT